MFMAIYKCRDCGKVEQVPRPYQNHLGPQRRCPKCGTLRVTKLRERDRIDRMWSGFLNWMERISGGSLYHCCFCRIQFYDRRKGEIVGTGATPGAPVEKAETAT
jgi:DNA-directed RNA polymerase subunit RPC12/RpoP